MMAEDDLIFGPLTTKNNFMTFLYWWFCTEKQQTGNQKLNISTMTIRNMWVVTANCTQPCRHYQTAIFYHRIQIEITLQGPDIQFGFQSPNVH